MSLQRFRTIRTSADNHLYLDLEFELGSVVDTTTKRQSIKPLEERDFLLVMLSAIESLFGEAGSAIQFDILKYRSVPSARAYVRVSARDYVRFRIAISLVSQWTDPNDRRDSPPPIPAQFVIHRACHTLSSLPVTRFCVDDHIGPKPIIQHESQNTTTTTTTTTT